MAGAQAEMVLKHQDYQQGYLQIEKLWTLLLVLESNTHILCTRLPITQTICTARTAKIHDSVL